MLFRPPYTMFTTFVLLEMATLVLGIETIPGPTSLDDKIAIVGAGPSGIHMAYKLIEAGFTKVTVFESSDYIGGKSKSIYHRRTAHDMGAYSTHQDYTELYKLVQEFDAGQLVSVPNPGVWLEKKPGSRRKSIMTMAKYSAVIAEQLNPDSQFNETQLFEYLFNAALKYKKIHSDLFGSYNGSLMPRPSEKTLSYLNMTFLEFLKLRDIEILKFLYIITMTAQGYGHLDEVSAIYGLMWMTPSYLTQLIFPPPEPGSSFNKILSKGNQFIWKEIVRQLNIDVRLSSPVTKIVRSRDVQTCFKVKYSTCGGEKEEEFDFLILSPTMKSLINTVNFNKKEKRLFGKTTHDYLATSLVCTKYGKRRSFSPRNYHVDNLLSKVDNKVFLQRDTYSALAQIEGDNYTAGVLPGGLDGDKIHSTMYYQLAANSKPGRQILERHLRRYINIVEKAEVVQLTKQTVWSYFPRYSVSDMSKGVLWDILDMQGKYGIWYIGSSVSFETLHSVLQYNNLLFQRYIMPTV